MLLLTFFYWANVFADFIYRLFFCQTTFCLFLLAPQMKKKLLLKSINKPNLPNLSFWCCILFLIKYRIIQAFFVIFSWKLVGKKWLNSLQVSSLLPNFHFYRLKCLSTFVYRKGILMCLFFFLSFLVHFSTKWYRPDNQTAVFIYVNKEWLILSVKSSTP